MSEKNWAADRSVRVVVATTDRAGTQIGERRAACVPLGVQMDIGREGDLQIADDPEDTSVSRIAISLRTVKGGVMALTVANLNGVVLHPWGSRTRYLPAGSEEHLIAGRVGVRVIGGTSLDRPDVLVYWVLVEGDPGLPSRIPLQRSAVTVQNPRPDDVTPAQLAAVRLVFGEHLAWPPRPAPLTLTIDAAARRIGVSAAAVIQRLEGVRKKAYALGMAQQYGVSDPEYVFALVAHGLLDPPTEPLVAEDLQLFDA